VIISNANIAKEVKGSSSLQQMSFLKKIPNKEIFEE
jgi:hypothetical protein